MTKYSNEFKVKAIKMLLKGNSISHVAKILNMPNIAPLYTGTISTWEKLYHSYGFSGLLAKKRGRPSMKKSKSKNKVNKPKKELSYVEKLEQEVYQLRMENDLLKKWHALMKQWEKEGRH